MSVRIRYVYHPTETCILLSKQFYIHPIDGSKYQVQLNEADKTYKIVEDMTGATVGEGSAVNLHQVKIKAKDHLTKLGIKFSDEKRKEEITTQ